VPRNGRLVIGPGQGVLTNDTDANGDALSAVLLTNPLHGTLQFNANGSFTYRPTPGYSGKDSFGYRANDGLANSNRARVLITVQ
jgi:VCBS repeat-containing protein